MQCTDQFLTFLKPAGYCVVRLPKADLKPLLLLTRQGKDLDRLGELATVLLAGGSVQLPPMSENVPAANISGKRTSDLNIGVGLSILGSVIGAMGGSHLGLDAKYGDARTLAFEFENVLEDTVELARVDQYLADADISPFSRHAAQLLDADEVYVTTATIKTSTFTIEAKRSDRTAVAVKVPEIQQVVGANVTISADDAVASKIRYHGKQPLVFGFQAVQLFYDQGHYTAYEPLDPGRLAMRSPAEQKKPTKLQSAGAFLRLS